jgi:hypothetical protein
MNAPGIVVLRDDEPEFDWEEGNLEFRLTYDGELLSETLKSGEVQRTRATKKQEIRKRFHRQLKRLWEITPVLIENERPRPPLPPGVQGRVFGLPGPSHAIAALAERFSRFDYQFVPLVTRDLDVACSVEVLFLRPDPPGNIIKPSGDIDNRLKTLFDALSTPRERSQVGDYLIPEDEEKPFFCLLEDDSVVTKATVETDTLLEPIGKAQNVNDVRVVVTVRLRPYRLTPYNIGFG